MHFPEINWGVAKNSQWRLHITSLPAPCSVLTLAFLALMVTSFFFFFSWSLLMLVKITVAGMQQNFYFFDFDA